jgi:hypothetical protein
MKLLIKRLGGLRVTAARRQGAYLENPNPSIECDRHHVAAFDLAACGPDPCAVDPHMAGGGKQRRAATRAYNARMP